MPADEVDVKPGIKAFTVVGLTVFFTIFGIITFVAIPRLLDFREERRQAARDRIAAIIESAVQVAGAKKAADSGSGAFPKRWQECIEPGLVSEIDNDYKINYNPATGRVVSITEK